MTTLELANHSAQAGEQLQDSFTRSAPPSPSAASSTSDSVFSNGDARSSQSSAPSSVKGSPLTYEPSDNDVSDAVSAVDTVSEQIGHEFSQASLSRDTIQRRNPRRTGIRTERATLQHESVKPVPSLVRQCDRKEQFVEALVDTATEMIEVIWPLSVAQCSLSQGGRHILDLRKFVQEVLRRSKTSHSTLQVALFYLMMLIPFVPKADVPELPSDPAQCRALRCGRRMFLAALILASKYLQDRNYTMSAWAKISGLKKEEICTNELAFLKTVGFDLHVTEAKYKVWTELVFKCSVDDECRMARAMNGGRCEKWRAVVPHLTPELKVTGSFDKTSPAVSCASTPATTPAAVNPWTPPASPPSSTSQRTASPSVGLPPPRFLEPKVTTPADRVRFPTSPRLSNLETPCLPPINLDCSPAASRSRFTSDEPKCPALGFAMKQVQNIALGRCSDRPCNMVPRTKGKLSRRSGLSQCSSSSGEDSFYQDEAVSTPSAARESYMRAYQAGDIGSESDVAAARAAESLLTLRNLNSAAAYPTPDSMLSGSTRSSFSAVSEDEVSTPKAEDPANRPVARTALKRARPASKCENDRELLVFGDNLVQSPETMALDAAVRAEIVKHRGGALVDYGAGVEDVVRARAPHMRSASGSRNGARKKPRSNLANCLGA